MLMSLHSLSHLQDWFAIPSGAGLLPWSPVCWELLVAASSWPWSSSPSQFSVEHQGGNQPCGSLYHSGSCFSALHENCKIYVQVNFSMQFTPVYSPLPTSRYMLYLCLHERSAGSILPTFLFRNDNDVFSNGNSWFQWALGFLWQQREVLFLSSVIISITNV